MNNIKAKGFLVFILLIVLFCFFPIIKADMFPKPTTLVKVIGMEEIFYFDLLFYSETTPKILDLNSDEVHELIENNYYLDYYPITPLNGYQDDEGFISYTLYKSIPHIIRMTENSVNSKVFKMGYYSPPKTFKIVIYTENEILLVSDKITTHLYHAEVTLDLTNVDKTVNTENVSEVTIHQKIETIFFNFLYRIILTVIVELAIFWIFGYRHKNLYVIVVLFNLFTQSILSLMMILGYYYWGAEFGAVSLLIIGEVFVLMTETIGFQLKIRPVNKSRLVFYAIVANVITFMISFFSINLF